MGTRRSARLATAALVASALVVGGTDSVSAEPVSGFEEAELVADFETVPAGSELDDRAVAVGDYVFLLQFTDEGIPDGTLLWEYHVPSDTIRRVDLAGFLQVIDLGTAHDGRLVFAAERDDGFGAPEDVLATVAPGEAPSVVRAFDDRLSEFAAGRDALYFVVADGALWSSDLTELGTIELASGLASMRNLAPAVKGDDSEVVYLHANGSAGDEPHRYDAGTGLSPFDVAAGTASSAPSDFHIVDGAAYFGATVSSVRGLYRLEGDDPGTVVAELLEDDVTGPFGSGRRVYVSFENGGLEVLGYFDHDADALTTVVAGFGEVDDGFPLGVEGLLLLQSTNGGGQAVWYTDGTGGGTVELRGTGPLDPPDNRLAGAPDAIGSSALFIADDGAGQRVWRYEPGGSPQAIDPSAFGGSFSSTGGEFFVSTADDRWVLAAQSSTQGFEPFRSSGTTASTAVISDLTPGTIGSSPSRFMTTDTSVEFTATRQAADEDIVIAVGTDAVPTERGLGLEPGDELTDLVREPDGSYLVVADKGVGRRFWLVRSTNGVATDLGALGSDRPRDLLLAGNRLFFRLSGVSYSGIASVRTDGSDLQQLGWTWRAPTPLGNGVVFGSSSVDPTIDDEPWFTDGTVAGTVSLGDLRSGSRGSFPVEFVEFGGAMYFRAAGSVWRTDGTEAGTTQVWNDLRIRQLGTVGDAGLLVRTADGLGFVTSAAGGLAPVVEPTYPNAPLFEVWPATSQANHAVSLVLDGGVTWIGVVDDGEFSAVEAPFTGTGTIEQAVTHRGIAYYLVSRHDGTQELWRTDGTADGTGSVWRQSTSTGSITTLIQRGDRVFFNGWTEDTGVELWTLDLRPAAPTGVTAVAGDASATVSWVALTDAGSQPITGYTVTASPGGAMCSTAGAVTCRVDGLTNGTPYTFRVVTTSGTSVSVPSAPSAPVTPRTPVPPRPPFDDIESVVPARLLDTRGSGETADGRFEKTGKVAADSFVELDVRGRAGVPDDAGAVVLNVTMIRPDGNGFVTIYPCGDRPLASSMNAPAGGGVVANEVIAKVSDAGTVCLYSSVGTNLAADVTGYVPASSGVVSLEPARLLDTRGSGETADGSFERTGKVVADSVVELDVLGRGGVPASGVGAVVLNVTMIRPDGNGFVTIYPCGDRPLASSMNAPSGGGVVANEVIAKVSDAGTVCLYSSVGTNLAVDVTGYVPVGTGVSSVEPARLLDTRATGETADGLFEKTGKVAADSFVELDVLGRGGVPGSDVGAVVLNVTMIRPDGNGFVTIYPCGDRPLASSMNAPSGGGVVANEVIAKVSSSGTVCLYSSVDTNLAADVTGYIAT